MHDLNDALDELRHVIPYAHSPSVRKLSKIATLLLAKNYILMQTNALNELRRVLICLQQQPGGTAIPQAMSASVATLLGTSAALVQSGTHATSGYKSTSWAHDGASLVSNSTVAGSCRNLVDGTKSSTVPDEQQATSVQNRRRKYNMLINRILGDVANHHLLNPLACFQPHHVQSLQTQSQTQHQSQSHAQNQLHQQPQSQPLQQLRAPASYHPPMVVESNSPSNPTYHNLSKHSVATRDTTNQAHISLKPINFCTQNKPTYDFVAEKQSGAQIKVHLKRRFRERAGNEVNDEARRGGECKEGNKMKKVGKQKRCNDGVVMPDDERSSMSSQSSTSCMSLVSVGSPVRACGTCRVFSEVEDAEDDTRSPIRRGSSGGGGGGGGRRSQSASTIVSSNEEEVDGIIFDAKADIGSTTTETEMRTLHHSKDTSSA